MELILASASPRRQELLHLITSRFTVLPADIDETLPPELPADHAAQYLAQLKAGITAMQVPDQLVIGCDTTEHRLPALRPAAFVHLFFLLTF